MALFGPLVYVGDAGSYQFHRNMRSGDSTLLVRRITDIDFVLCAAPAYLAGAPPLTDPACIGEHDCLVHINDPVWHLRRDGEVSA